MLSQKNSEAIFKAVPVPCLILSPDKPRFTILEVNNAYSKVTKTKESDLINKSILEAVPENTEELNTIRVKNLWASLDQVLATKVPHKMAIQKYDIPVSNDQESEVRYYRPENIPVLDEKEEVEYIIHAVMDVTGSVLSGEREKTVRNKLLKSQEYYRSLFDYNPDAVFSFDLNGNFLSVNEGLARLLKRSTDELLKTPFTSFVAPEDLKAVSDHLKKAGKGEIQYYNTDMITAFGNRLSVNITNLPIVVNDRIIGVHGIAKDITKAVKVAKELQQSREQLQKIIDQSLDVICTIDEEGNFVKVGAASKIVWGYLPEELVGKKYITLVYEEDIDLTIKAERDVRSGSKVTSFENRYKRKNGEIIPVIWSAKWDDNEKIFYCVAKDATEIKKAEKQLKEYNNRISTILESITDGFYAVDKNWIVTYWNKKAEEMFGLSRENILGKNLWEVYQDAISFKFYEKFHYAISENVSSHFEEYYPPINKWLEISAYPSEDGLSIYFRDITERKYAEEQIRLSKERYDILAKATNDVIWDWDLNHSKILWNNTLQIEIGYNILETDTNWWYEHIHPEDRERVIHKIHDYIDNARAKWNDEYRFLCADGSYKYFYDRGFLILDEQQNPVRMIGAMQDITAQKEEEHRLKLLESVITNATDAIMITDAEPIDEPGPKIVYVNKAFTEMTGYSKEETIGRSPRFLQGPKSDRAELNRLRKALENSETCEIETINYKKNGEEFRIHMAISHVANNINKVTHLIAIIRDITERMKNIQAIKEQNERLREISWTQSHLVRAPLARIMGLIYVLSKTESHGKTQEEILQSILNSAKELDNVIRDIVYKTEIVNSSEK